MKEKVKRLKKIIATVLSICMAVSMIPTTAFAEEASVVTLSVSTSELIVAGDPADVEAGVVTDAFTDTGDAAVVVSVEGDAATYENGELTPVKPGAVTVKAELTGESYQLEEGYSAAAVTKTVTVSWPTFANTEEALAYYQNLDDDTQDLFAEDFPQYFNTEEIETTSESGIWEAKNPEGADNTQYTLNSPSLVFEWSGGSCGNNNVVVLPSHFYLNLWANWDLWTAIFINSSKQGGWGPNTNHYLSCTAGKYLFYGYAESGTHTVHFYPVTDVYCYDGNSTISCGSYVTDTYKRTGRANSFTLPSPTKDGYTLDGWYTNADGTGTKYNAGDTVSGYKGATLNLYAQWVKTSTVTFNNNGGTGGPETRTMTVGSGNNKDLNGYKPTRTGYTFDGWFTESTGGTMVYDRNGYAIRCGATQAAADANQTYWTGGTEDGFDSDWEGGCYTKWSTMTWNYSGSTLTLYAHWHITNPVAKIGDTEYPTLQEAIDAATNGQTIVVNQNIDNVEVTVPEGKNITLDLNGKTLTGVQETGTHNTITNNGTLTIEDSVGTGIVQSATDIGGCNEFFRCVYSTGDLTINGGTYETRCGYANKKAFNYIDTIYVKSGTTTINGGTIKYTYTGSEWDEYSVALFQHGGTLYVNGGNIIRATAYWAIVSHGGTAYVQGGNITGKVFGGDYTGDGQTFSGEMFVSGGVFDTNPSQYAKIATGYSVKANTPTTGKWTVEASTYSITYNLNGGTNAESNPTTYTYGTEVTLVNPTKAGYTFDGWYDAATGGNKVESIANNAIGNKTLYAKWSVAEGYFSIQCATNTSYYVRPDSNGRLQLSATPYCFYIEKDTTDGYYNIYSTDKSSKIGVKDSFTSNYQGSTYRELYTQSEDKGDRQKWKFDYSAGTSGAYNIQLKLDDTYVFNVGGGIAGNSNDAGKYVNVYSQVRDPNNSSNGHDGTNERFYLTNVKSDYTYNNENYTISNLEVTTPVAYVLDTSAKTAVGYGTLADAINNADGKTVVLLKDINNVEVTVSNEVTLDLNGKTLTGKKETGEHNVITVASGGNLTINGDGTVQSAEDMSGSVEWYRAIKTSGTLVINGGTYETRCGYQDKKVYSYVDTIYIDGGTTTINGGTIKYTNDWNNDNGKTYDTYSVPVFQVGGTLYVNGGEIERSGIGGRTYWAIVSHGGKAYVTGGTITGGVYGGTYSSFPGGSVTVSGGVFNCNPSTYATVATGYQALENTPATGKWTVMALAEVTEGYYKIKDNDNQYFAVSDWKYEDQSHIDAFTEASVFHVVKSNDGYYQIKTQAEESLALNSYESTHLKIYQSTSDNSYWRFLNSTADGHSGDYVILPKTCQDGAALFNDTDNQYRFKTINTADATQAFTLEPAYSITYNSNGGSAVDAANVAQIPSSLPTPTMEGYTFAGWYTDADFTTKAKTGTVLTQNITLYAQWISNDTTVTVSTTSVLLGADGKAIDSSIAAIQGGGDVLIGEVTLTAKLLTQGAATNIQFVGWFKTSDTERTNKLSSSATWTANVIEDEAYVAVYQVKNEDTSATLTLKNNNEGGTDNKGIYTVVNNNKEVGEEGRITSSEANSASFSTGTGVANVTVKYEQAGNKTVYWLNSSGHVVGTGETYTATILGDVTLTAVTVKQTKEEQAAEYALVRFSSYYGQVVDNQSYNIGSDEQLTLPSIPSRTGYAAKAWKFNGKEYKVGTDDASFSAAIKTAATNNGEILDVNPVYTKLSETATLKVVIDGTEDAEMSKDVTVGEGTSLTAPSVDGKVFSYWTVNDVKVSSNETYKFIATVAGNTYTVAAVYENEVVAKSPSTGISEIIYDTSVNKYKVVANYDVPEGYTLVEAGIYFARTEEEFNAKKYHYVSNVTSPCGMIRMTVNTQAATLYVMSYIIYIDGNGDTQTVVSNNGNYVSLSK